MHLYLSTRGAGPTNAVYALNSESAIALLETGCVTCISFGADWPEDSVRNLVEAIAVAKFLKVAVAEARIPWVAWHLHCNDLAQHHQLTVVLQEMDEICRHRGQAIQLDPAQLDAVGLNPDFSFERLILGEGNEMAYAQAVLAGIGAPTRNVPLWIFGACGLGKTHMLHAIGWQYLAVNPGRRVALLHASEMSEQEACAAKLKGVDALLIDDIQCFEAIWNVTELQKLTASISLLAVTAEKSVCKTANVPQLRSAMPAWIEVALASPGPALASALLDGFLVETRCRLDADLRRTILAISKRNPRTILAMVKKITAYQRFENKVVDPLLLTKWFE